MNSKYSVEYIKNIISCGMIVKESEYSMNEWSMYSLSYENDSVSNIDDIKIENNNVRYM